MYFYNSLLLISNILILTVQTQTETTKGPGKSACSFYNFICEICGKTFATSSELPEECSSMVINGVSVDLDYSISAAPFNPALNRKYLGNLDEVLTLSKPVYLLYGYSSQSEWIQVLDCGGGNNPPYEMKSWEAFFNEHPGITGLILLHLDNNEDSKDSPGFSENLKKYLEVMKKTFPQLQIGMEFEGPLLIDQYTNPKIPWLDIKVIETHTDFFIIDVAELNECTDESLYNSGVSPMNSTTTDYTMEKIKCILPQLSIPKEKLYFRYILSPKADPKGSLTYCDMTIQQMCENPSGTSGFCSDTMESFYEKGKFASVNGAGFVVNYLEMNDPKNICKCEKPFGSFYAILNGFEGGNPSCCELFPRK